MSTFISYASANRGVVDSIVAGLERRGVSCWYAPRDIAPGVSYAEAIVAAISDCAAMVVVVSASALDSVQVQREVERCTHYRKAVLPFRIEDVPLRGGLEFFLSVSHWLDASKPPLDQHLDRLAAALQGLPHLRAAPTTQAAPTRGAAPAPATEPLPETRELEPDRWSERPSGKIAQFFSRLLQDPDS